MFCICILYRLHSALLQILFASLSKLRPVVPGNERRKAISTITGSQRPPKTKEHPHFRPVVLELMSLEPRVNKQPIRRRRPARSIGVRLRLDLVPFNLVQQRREDLPALFQLIAADKVVLVSLENVENQSFVGVGDVGGSVALGIREVELGNGGVVGVAGGLDHHFHVDGFVGLDADDEFVAGERGVEVVAGYVAELDTDVDFLVVERLAALEDERHAFFEQGAM